MLCCELCWTLCCELCCICDICCICISSTCCMQLDCMLSICCMLCICMLAIDWFISICIWAIMSVALGILMSKGSMLVAGMGRAGMLGNWNGSIRGLGVFGFCWIAG